MLRSGERLRFCRAIGAILVWYTVRVLRPSYEVHVHFLVFRCGKPTGPGQRCHSASQLKDTLYVPLTTWSCAFACWSITGTIQMQVIPPNLEPLLNMISKVPTSGWAAPLTSWMLSTPYKVIEEPSTLPFGGAKRMKLIYGAIKAPPTKVAVSAILAFETFRSDCWWIFAGDWGWQWPPDGEHEWYRRP